MPALLQALFPFPRAEVHGREGFIFEDGYCRNFRVPTVQQWVNELHEAATAQRDGEDRLPADREPAPAG